jgi:hypothetical protein
MKSCRIILCARWPETGQKAKKNEHQQSSGCRQEDETVNRALLVAAKQFRGGRLKRRTD